MEEDNGARLVAHLAGAVREAERFDQLYTEWQMASRYMSNATQMAEHPAYQAIIAMGEDAIPLILQALMKKLDHWFLALQAISGAHPVPKAEWGDMGAMRRRWLDWGVEQGYILQNWASKRANARRSGRYI